MDQFLRNTLWLSFFGVVLASWWAMYAMAMDHGLDWIGRPLGCIALTMSAPGYLALLGMWAAMMAAMMLPTLIPTLRTYDDLTRSADGTPGGWLGIVLGYGAVWLVGSAGFAAAQLWLASWGVVDHLGAAQSRMVAGALLIGAGLYQFTRAKAACQDACLSPFQYFLRHWRPGAPGGVRMGLGMGAYCVGCCWAIMALGFVGGVMSLLWMGLATLFMVVEKLPQIGRYVTRPAGGALILGGAGVILWPLVFGGV